MNTVWGRVEMMVGEEMGEEVEGVGLTSVASASPMKPSSGVSNEQKP